MSLTSDIANSIPIHILHGTGTNYSLLLEGIFFLELSSATGVSIIAQGIEGCFVNIPFHNIYSASDLVSGPVVVGVRSTLSIRSVSLLLGKDLARVKLVAESKMVNELITVSSKDEVVVEENPDMFSLCAVTLAQAKKLIQK